MIYKLNNYYFIEENKHSGILLEKINNEDKFNLKNNKLLLSDADKINYTTRESKLSKDNQSNLKIVSELNKNKIYLIEELLISILCYQFVMTIF